MRRVYLDYSATTPLDPRVLEAMSLTFGRHYGNASSVHSFGREARTVLEESRERIASFIGARSEEIFFTSGGTEADNYAIKGVASAGKKKGKNHIIISSIEHHAVLHPAEHLRAEGFKVDVLPVDSSGMVDPAAIEKTITPGTCLISIMHANNEVGTIEPVREISASAKQHGILLHSDTVQSVGKIPVNVNELGVDLLSISAHKIYGPKGIGAIYIRKGTEIETLIEGGAQESNRRAGTENVPLAVGFAKAIELCSVEEETKRLSQMRESLKSKLLQKFDALIVNGHPEARLPHILSVSFDSTVTSVDGEALIMGMDLRGVAVTSGSACTSGSLQSSHVLLAMGRDERTAKATIRFSLGRLTTEDEITYAAEALEDVLSKMRSANL
ncbi:MAG: cysteine desulfurase [Ignavibacteriales bacterium]|nr:cysteine desulfurase [Ignavibacteriales bacterium]